MNTHWLVVVLLLLFPYSCWGQQDPLALDAKMARTVALSMRSSGRVGGALDFRVIGTNRSFNYKLRATWLTPDIIRATARLMQLTERLSDEQTIALVNEAENAGDTVIMVEIDPREGSGVIPNDWLAFLRPSGGSEAQAVKGTNTPKLQKVRALAGAARRDYAWDVFWVTFPLTTAAGKPLFDGSNREVELIVQIYNKAGTVRWTMPDSISRGAEATGATTVRDRRR
jgi:hypothetical protein